MTTKTTDKAFDMEDVITNLERNTKSCVDFIYPETARTFAQTMTGAGFEFARAQMAATRALHDGVRRAFQI
jgi:hypothetical protein